MTTGELARLTSVSIRTLRFYDTAGLLSPSQRSEAGYRLYGDEDLTRLQQILALKFLGFALAEIKTMLGASPMELHDALEQQQAMLQERRQQLDAVLAAVDQARAAIQADGQRWDSVVRVIRAIQMTENNDWHTKYFTPEQREAMERLGRGSYSEEAKANLATRSAWTEADQQRVDAQYAALWDGVRQAHAAGEVPEGARGRELAGQAISLIEAFTQGNAAVAEGLQDFWNKLNELPKDQRPFQIPLTDEESAWLEEAKAAYRRG